MTKAIIWFGILIGAAGGGFLGHTFAFWMSPNPIWGLLLLAVAVGGLVGGFFGMLLGYIAAGLIEQ